MQQTIKGKKYGRPFKIGLTVKQQRDLARAVNTEHDKRKTDVNFDLIDMNSDNLWTDNMGKSVFITDSKDKSKSDRKRAVMEPIRLSSKSSVRNNPTANRFR